MSPTILRDRLDLFERADFTLDRGGHGSFEEGHCATESADWLTGGEPCISPELRSMFQTLNDRWDDEARQLLKPYILRALGTKGDGDAEKRRTVCAEWLLHESLPAWMEAAGCAEVAKRLRELPADLTSENVRRALVEVREEAWDARRKARAGLKERVRAELAKRGLSAAAAYAYAAAAAYAYADAAAYAYAYAADADAAAAAAYAYADADAAAAAYAYAAYAYAAYAYADGTSVYSAVYDAVRKAVDEKLKPLVDERRQATFELLDRLLPEAPALEVAEAQEAA